MSGVRINVPLELDDATLDAIAERLAERIRATTSDASPWMNINHAADYLAWPKDRIYKLTSAGTIPHRKHGNRILFRREELDSWLSTTEKVRGQAGNRPLSFPSISIGRWIQGFTS